MVRVYAAVLVDFAFPLWSLHKSIFIQGEEHQFWVVYKLDTYFLLMIFVLIAQESLLLIEL